MEMIAVFLQDYPLSQQGLASELYLWSEHECAAVFFGSTFPWSNETSEQLPWTYPEQLFPRLSRIVVEKSLNIIPAVTFPDGVPFLNGRRFESVLNKSREHPQPVWNLLEDAVIDLMSLCDWTRECAVTFGENVFPPDFLCSRTDRLEKEQGIRLVFPRYNNGIQEGVPRVVSRNEELIGVQNKINSIILQGWNIIRMVREHSFVSLERPSKMLHSLEEAIGHCETERKAFIQAAVPVLSQDWAAANYSPAIAALKEEYALLNSRFLVS